MQWTQEKELLLAKQWGRMKTAKLAREIGTTSVAIYCKAKELGLPNLRVQMTQELRLAIRELWYRKYTEVEIAEKLDIGKTTVSRTLRQMGCPPRHDPRKGGKSSPRSILRARRGLQKVLKERGMEYPGELFLEARAKKAQEAGWPEARSLNEVALLKLLQEGEACIKQLHSKVNLSMRSVRTILGSMRKRGLVEMRAEVNRRIHRMSQWMQDRHPIPAK